MTKAKGKKISQYTIEGELINTFDSIMEASRITGCHREGIRLASLGKRNHTGGYKWELYK